MRIKICGLRREEDIDYVNKLKPDYVGFIFAKSKRQVSVQQGMELAKKVARGIKKVGVFVNSPTKEVKEIARICELDVLQFHGEEEPDSIQNYHQDVWKAFRIKDENSFKRLDEYSVKGYLLDTFMDGEIGGTGRTFDWSLIPDVHKEKFIILAGGLVLENIISAIDMVHPHVVDINSGVEINGYKDFNKMKEIIEKVRK